MYVGCFKKLIEAEVKFLILGGAAVSLHAFARMTTGIDILLENSPENITRFVSATTRWGAGSGADVTFESLQGPGCVRIIEDFPLDVFTMLDGKSYEYFIGDAVKYSLPKGVDVWCLSVAALIELKKGTQREKDQLDVTILRRLRDKPNPGEPPRINLEVPPEQGLTRVSLSGWAEVELRSDSCSRRERPGACRRSRFDTY